MAFAVGNLVLEQSNAPGVGDFVLQGQVAGRQTFAGAIGNGNTTYYFAVQSDGQFERGETSVQVGATIRLPRETVRANSNGTVEKIDFTGLVTVYVEIPAERTPYQRPDGTFNLLEGVFARKESAGALGGVTSINGGPLAGFRNAIINGGFDIWQRGTSFSSTGYTADRWQATLSTSGASGNVSREAFAAGQADVPGNPEYFFRHTRSSAATSDNSVITQLVEGVRAFAGQQVVLSFHARVESGTKALYPKLIQNFGSGGSPSSNVVVVANSVDLTADWQRFEIQFDVPSITGKSLGTNGDDSLQVVLVEQAPYETWTVDVALFQLEQGSVATPFEQRPIPTERALCHRYYLRMHTAPGSYGVAAFFAKSAASLRGFIPTPVEMRAVPAMSLTGWTYTGSGGSLSIGSPGAIVAQPNGMYILDNGVSGAIANEVYVLTSNASNFLELDAELQS